MKQKLLDLKLKLQRDRKTQAFAIIGAVILMLYFVIDSKGNTSRSRVASLIPDQMQQNTSQVRPNNDEPYHDLVERFSNDLSEIKTATERNTEDNKKIKTDLAQYEARTAEIFKKVLERIQETESGGMRQAHGGPGGAVEPQDAGVENVSMQQDGAEADGVEAWGTVNEPEAAIPPPLVQGKVARVSPGDSVRVKLLAGVNAPTDGTPYPVVFQLVSDVYGPNGSALGLGEARLVAAAQGSLVDSRALFRLTTLSIEFPDGRRKEVDVDGWIVGEDGIRGMAGVTIDPIGKAIGGTVLAGAIQGVGQGFPQAQLTTTTNNING
ncbi:MAG: hypothetical protein J0M12_15470, partial [Deltaproteobacteria bacterium]|nr:hypothetical protein [Deltaproteobacteria bacterium]